MSTAEKISETDCCNYKEKYENLLREYQDFAYVVSHDLQSPVRQMSGFVEILMQEIDGELSEHHKCYSNMIQHAGQEASDALEALLEFSRLNTDEKKFTQFDLNEIVGHVVAAFETKKEKTGARITVKDLPKIKADAALISRLYTYLLSNAFKFRNTEGQPEIEVGVTDRDGVQVFYVKDNGIGMNPEKAEEAFIMFRRLNAADTYPGRGAGLTFARKIVDIHNGDLWIETLPEKGSTIFFTLNAD